MPAKKNSNRSRNRVSKKPSSVYGNAQIEIWMNRLKATSNAFSKFFTAGTLIFVLVVAARVNDAITTAQNRMNSVQKTLKDIPPAAGLVGRILAAITGQEAEPDPYQTAHPTCYKPAYGETAPKVENAPPSNHNYYQTPRRRLFRR